MNVQTAIEIAKKEDPFHRNKLVKHKHTGVEYRVMDITPSIVLNSDEHVVQVCLQETNQSLIVVNTVVILSDFKANYSLID